MPGQTMRDLFLEDLRVSQAFHLGHLSYGREPNREAFRGNNYSNRRLLSTSIFCQAASNFRRASRASGPGISWGWYP